MYKFLRFFDKTGTYCNFQYDSVNDKWIGRFDFGTVSEGLAQVQSLYILEEVFNSTEGINDYSLPITSGIGEFLGSFNKIPLVEDIFMFSPSQYDLVKTYESTFSISTQSYTLDANGMKIISQPVNSMVQIDFGFLPSIEEGYQTIFYLKDVSGNTILELTLYGEAEGEDDRLRDLLTSIGNDILPSDSIIFDTSNVNESNPDWSLINRKRKELLLEYQNIFPYVGSYKALINIMKFYGYQNVRMKEYWKNVDMTSPNFGKFRQTNIIDLFSDQPDPQISNLIPSKIYKKTNLFGLFYDITVATNEYDEDGIPIVEEVYTFTPEEVLIKLFALKRKLQEYYLPLNAKIVDIIGEAIYFANYRLNIVTSQNRIDAISLGIKPTYNINPSPEGYMQDLRPLQWRGAPVGYDIGASAYTNFKVWMPIVSSGATVTPATGYATLYMQIGGMTAGRVELRRDRDRGNYVYSQNEVRELLVNSFNNPSYIPGFNNQTDIELIKTRAYAYVDDSGGTAGQIRVVERIPYFSTGATVGIVVVVTPPMSVLDAPTSVTSSALDPSPGGSFGPTGAPISFYKAAYIGYFNESRVEVDKLNDAPDIPVGYPIVLENTSFDITWDNADVTFNQVDGIGSTFNTLYSHYTNSFIIPAGTAGWTTFSVPAPIGVTGFPSATFPTQYIYTWENLGYYGHVEMQWIISKEADETPAYYYDSGQKSIQLLNDLPLILPYVGKYTVKLKLWDLYNMQSFRIDESVIDVKMAESDFISWYSKRELEYNIDTPKYRTQTDRYLPPPPLGTPTPMLTWDEYSSTWDLPLHPNEPIEMAEISTNSLDSIEFYQSMENPIDNPLVDRYAYTWDLLGNQASWDDAYHLWWDNTGTRVVEWELHDFSSITTSPGLTGIISIVPPGRLKVGLESSEYGPILYTDGPTGWQGATSNAITTAGSWVDVNYGGYIKGMVMYVKSEKAVFIHDGTEWKRTPYVMDAVIIPVPQPTLFSIANKRAQYLSTLEILNNLSETEYPILSKFIYYYNEEYGGSPNYWLYPKIKAVSKDFEVDQKYYINASQVDTNTTSLDDWLQYDDHCYSTVYFGYLGDIPAHFEIVKIPNSGGTFTVEYVKGNPVGPTNSYTYNIPAGITTLGGLCNELNGATAQSLPVIGDFVYNMVYGASGWTGGAGPTTISEVKLQGVLKRFTSDQVIKCTYGTGMVGTVYGRSLIKNPTWDNLRMYRHADELPILTTVNFTYDNCKIKGKTKSTWKLAKEDDLTFSDIYYNNQYFSYMFNQKGSYSVSLTIEDSNGNKKTIKKPEIIKIV